MVLGLKAQATVKRFKGSSLKVLGLKVLVQSLLQCQINDYFSEQSVFLFPSFPTPQTG